MNIVKRLVAASTVACGISAFAATECVWIGGKSGDIMVAKNWSGGIVPHSSETPYIAVFTNSVELTASDSWYSGGIIVSNNAAVLFSKTDSGQRCYPCRGISDRNFVVDVEEGSSLAFYKIIFYAYHRYTLVKKGGGTFAPNTWCGNPNSSGAYWNNVDIQEGTLKFPSGGTYTCITNTLYIRSGATAAFTYGNPFSSTSTADYSFSQPRVEIDAGGVLDMNGKNVTISSLSGAGTVSNCSNTLTLMLRDSGEIFTGEILGGGELAITPDAEWTAPDAEWIVGSATALKGVSLVRNTLEGFDYEVKFLPGIFTYYANEIPTDIPSFDTNGVPVEIARSGKFWYVDCNRTGEAGDGKSPETAFQTLAEASTNSLLADGDTVWVAPGVYSNGTVSATQGGVTTYARASVKAGVRFVSLEGPEKTVIAGESSAMPIENGYGCGPGAVRCVVLRAGSTLRGFTLRDGRVYAENTTANNNSVLGGGVFAEESSIVIGCVISNSVALRGGGGFCGRYFSCHFFGNRALGPNVGAHLHGLAYLYNCVFSGGLGAVDWYTASVGSFALNCTFDYNPKGSLRGYNGELQDGENVITVYNSLVLSSAGSAAVDKYCRCIMYDPKTEDAIIAEDCTVTDLTPSTAPTIYQFVGVNGTTLKPRKWTSRVVAAADAEAYLELFPVAQYWLSIYDADFKPRIYDGKLDIGAFSFDRSTPYPSLKISIR